MKVLTIQSGDLEIVNRIFPDNTKCNHINALPVYQRLFEDYNTNKKTSYKGFFWAFSDLRTKDLKEAIFRAVEMIGIDISAESKEQVFILEVPDEICLVSDFYNFSDEIYAYENPGELDSMWENIYSTRKSEKQVIFPYIDESMILMQVNLKNFAISFEEARKNKLTEIQEMLNRMSK